MCLFVCLFILFWFVSCWFIFQKQSVVSSLPFSTALLWSIAYDESIAFPKFDAYLTNVTLEKNALKQYCVTVYAKSTYWLTKEKKIQMIKTLILLFVLRLSSQLLAPIATRYNEAYWQQSACDTSRVIFWSTLSITLFQLTSGLILRHQYSIIHSTLPTLSITMYIIHWIYSALCY